MSDDVVRRLELQAAEHEAWVAWATMMRDIGFDLNAVDVVTFEPVRVALCRWALTYARGYVEDVFSLPEEVDLG